MAFNPSDMAQVTSVAGASHPIAPSIGNPNGSPQNILGMQFHYNTADTLEEVDVPNYFIAAPVRSLDIIYVNASNGYGAYGIYSSNGVPPSFTQAVRFISFTGTPTIWP